MFYNKSMKKILYILFIFIFIFPLFSEAQTNEKDSCSFYFDESSIVLDVDADSSVYEPGDPVLIKGQITNESSYLLKDLLVKGRLVKESSDGVVILEEFDVLKGIELPSKSTKDISYNYLLPTNYSSGDYNLLFFVTNNYSELASDLPSNTFANIISFSLENGGDGVGVLLDTQDIDLSKMVFPVTNYSDSSKDVSVKYYLYKNNFRKPENLIDQNEQKITIDSGETSLVNYENETPGLLVVETKVLSETDESVYKAQTINYFQITKEEAGAKISLNIFDLENSKQVVCFETVGSFNSSFKGKTEITIVDVLGNEIYKSSKDVVLYGADNGFISEIDKNKIRREVTIYTKLYDSNGNVVDQTENNFSCEELGGICGNSSTNSSLYVFIIILAVFTLLVGIITFIKKKINIELV